MLSVNSVFVLHYNSLIGCENLLGNNKKCYVDTYPLINLSGKGRYLISVRLMGCPRICESVECLQDIAIKK